MSNVIEALAERGLIEACTSPDIKERTKKPIKVYCGFDPTADSLHVGNMVAIMGLAHFQRCGHTPVVVLGGATGMIGDPSGKSVERNLLNEEQLKKNIAGIESNLRPLLKQRLDLAAPLFVDNLDWFKSFSMIQFLRDVGKHFRANVMLAKESVKARLESEEGISYTEFSYQLLQAYDFLHLYQNYGVELEIGGSDQWGNITSGCELVRKVCGAQVYGVTLPLLVRADGTKFGKSEKGAIWLSSEKLAPYEFYQYLFRTDDRDVIRLLKMLTFMDMNEIHRLEQSMKKPDYIPNSAQKILAKEVTELVHGEEGVLKALQATEKVLPGKVVEVSAAELRDLMKDVLSKKLPKVEVVTRKLIDVVVQAGFLASKGEARRLIQNGGLYLNNQKIEDSEYHIMDRDLIEGQFLLFALGKKNKAIIEIN